MSNNYEENNKQLINEAGNTIFENIYKNCHNEIKDEIITKLLAKIQEQNQKINSLEKENKKLKDNFIYILKRILSNKDEFSTNNAKSNNLITSYNSSKNRQIKGRNNNISYAIKQQNSKEIYKINNIKIKPLSNTKNRNELNSSIDNISLDDNVDDEQKKDINDIKAKKYLNDLYRNNFGGTDGTPYSNFINKNKSLYDELFPKQVNKSNILTDIGSSYDSPNKRCESVNSSRRNRSTGIRKKILIEDFDNDSSIKKQNKNNKNKNYESGSVTDRKNYHSIEKKQKNRHNDKNRNNALINHKNKKYVKSIATTESNKKSKNNFSFVKRSPYLLNKF